MMAIITVYTYYSSVKGIDVSQASDRSIYMIECLETYYTKPINMSCNMRWVLVGQIKIKELKIQMVMLLDVIKYDYQNRL